VNIFLNCKLCLYFYLYDFNYLYEIGKLLVKSVKLPDKQQLKAIAM